MLHHTFPRACLALLLPVLLAGSVAGQLPRAQLTSVFPPGGKVGTTVEVTVAGVDLDEADQLLFTHPGLKATPKMTEATELQKTPKRLPTKFLVQIAADVPPGIYEVRAVGRFGISNRRSFAVGTLEETLETAANNAPDKAIELPIGATFSGRVDASNYDYLKVTLKKDQQILLDCSAERIDSRLNPTLVVLSPAGQELARVRDCLGDDPVLAFTAPAEGSYTVKVFDAVFAGGADYFYRLSTSMAPFVDFVFPPAGTAGSTGQYTVYGRNLPGGQPAEGLSSSGVPLQKLSVSITLPGDEMSQQRLQLGTQMKPRRAFLDGFQYQLASPQGTANPVTVYFARANPVVEQEPNDAADKATKVTLPCEVMGQFYPERDIDWVQFEAKKGEEYTIEIFSHRLGLDSDPYMALTRVTKNDKGEEEVKDIAQMDDPSDRNTRIGGEFDTSTDDPSYRFTAPEDGTYRLMVRDQFGDGRKDPSYIYRLVIEPRDPDFRLLVLDDAPAPAQQRQQNASPLSSTFVRKGGATSVAISVQRRDDFKGEIHVSAEGLPKGVTCAGAVLGGEVTSGELVFLAEENAPAWAGPVTVIGKATIDGKEVVREARCCQTVWATTNRQQVPADFRLTRQFQIAVIDADFEPARVQVGEDKVWETAVGGNLEIPVTIVRRGDFKEAIKLAANGLPNEIKPKEVNLAANDNAGKFELSLNQQNIKPGSYTFYLKGETKRKYVRNPDAIPAAEAEQKEMDAMVKQLAEQSKKAAMDRDAATKAAAEAATAATKADQAKTAATTAAKQKADAAKAAADAFAKAKEAEAKDAGNQALKDASAAAQKKSEDAANEQKSAEEQLAAATKAATDAAAKSKAAGDAKTAAETALKQAQDKEKQAQAMKAAADKRVADAKKDNAPKDLNFVVVSTPVKLRIASSPLTIEPANPAAPLKAGEKLPFSAKVARLYGFADTLELTIEPPAGVKGLSAPKVTLKKEEGEAKFELAAAKDATPGDHSLVIKAKGKFNNVNFENTATVTVKVQAP